MLQKNTKLYGPMNALDCSRELTCWNSEGSPEGKTTRNHFVVEFCHPVIPVELCIQFQAGFVAEEMTVFKRKERNIIDSDNDNTDNNDNVNEWIQMDEAFEVDDDHEMQSFSLPVASVVVPKDVDGNGGTKDVTKETTTTALKLVFDECTDFYGRITIYKLQVWGRKPSTTTSRKMMTPNLESSDS